MEVNVLLDHIAQIKPDGIVFNAAPLRPGPGKQIFQQVEQVDALRRRPGLAQALRQA